MPLNVDYYEGREQSYLKHLFLQKYLENAAYKLFQGRSPVFNFVDAFAGPWQNADTKSQSDTSFALALTTLENVRRILERIGRRDLKVRFRFCERNPESFTRLQAFATENAKFEIKVFSGAFEDNLGPIEAACRDIGGSFTFTFVDPDRLGCRLKPNLRVSERPSRGGTIQLHVGTRQPACRMGGRRCIGWAIPR